MRWALYLFEQDVKTGGLEYIHTMAHMIIILGFAISFGSPDPILTENEKVILLR